MDKKEIAMHLTKKAIEKDLIPCTGEPSETADIDKIVAFNAGQIANFYNKILQQLHD